MTSPPDALADGAVSLKPKLTKAPARLLVDTDLGSDCDDAGALAVLHALADLGEVEIAACVYSSGRNPYGPGAIAAINAWYGRGEIPIGASPESEIGDPRNDFLEAVATDTERYGHTVVRREEVPSLVEVYRRALAESPDRGLRVVSIGHLCGLKDLLDSSSDEWSPLSGRDLVEQKVELWVAMGGAFPEEKEPGWNLGRNGAAVSSGYVLDQWPTPLILHGYEVGASIITGRSLQRTPSDNPVREIYRLWENALETGRASWDQVAVLCAIRGHEPYGRLQRGRCVANAEGQTLWEDDPAGLHAYFVKTVSDGDLSAEVETLMSAPPARLERS